MTDVEADARVAWRVEIGEDEANESWSHDWRYVIRITDANGTREYFDHGEPEDNTFYRDYDWIVPELQRAYAAGAADREQALKQAEAECYECYEALSQQESDWMQKQSEAAFEAKAEGAAEERARILAWLRGFGRADWAYKIADELEADAAPATARGSDEATAGRR